MYCQHFGFEEKPFDVTPNPKFIFASEAHREALASLIYGIRERRGFVVLVGEVGTGKTLLLNTVLDRLDEQVKTAFIYNTAAPFDQFMTLALSEFGIAKPTDTLSQVDIIHRLNQFAIDQLSNNGNVVLIIDEAQNLSLEDLEKIRLLSNLETRQRKLVQIVLSGQPELEVKLATYELRQLAQRINIKRHILPLSTTEAIDYINHRLVIAGHRGADIFTRQALDMIVSYSGGIPRRINMLCDNALLIAFGLGKTKINESVIAEAVNDLNWIPTPIPAPQPQASPQPLVRGSNRFADLKKWAVPALMGLLVFGLGIWWGHFQFGKETPTPKPNPAQEIQRALPADQPAKAPTSAAATPQPNTLNADKKSVPNGGLPLPSPTQANGTDAHPADSQAVAPANEQTDAPPQDAASQKTVVEPHAFPKELGDITVSYGENLGNLIQRVYGEFDFLKMRNVLSANPQLTNPNVLEIGDVLRFPATPLQADLTTETSPRYWITLSELDSLEKSHTVVRNLLASGISARVISRWNEKKGLRFDVVLKQFVDSPDAATPLIKALPPEIASKAKVSQLLEADWVYFTNPLLLPKNLQSSKSRARNNDVPGIRITPE